MPAGAPWGAPGPVGLGHFTGCLWSRPKLSLVRLRTGDEAVKRRECGMATYLRARQAGWGVFAVALALACTTARPAWADILPSDPNAMGGSAATVSLYDFVGAPVQLFALG